MSASLFVNNVIYQYKTLVPPYKYKYNAFEQVLPQPDTVDEKNFPSKYLLDSSSVCRSFHR